jgi:hypothetical protein
MSAAAFSTLCRLSHSCASHATCCLQEFKLLIIRQVFKYGNVAQWRNVIRNMTANEVPGIQLTRVPASTFQVCTHLGQHTMSHVYSASARDCSWWAELPPEQQTLLHTQAADNPGVECSMLFHAGRWLA